MKGLNMIENMNIDEALKFYNLDNRYRKICYDTMNKIDYNIKLSEDFKKLYNMLYNDNFDDVKKLWDINNISDFNSLLENSFVTNLLILCGYEIHKNTMEKLKLNQNQINIHKNRVKECFEDDLLNRKYSSVRISQMLWAIYFIRGRIVEVGSLQYEYEDEKNIKIHIPKKTNLSITKVKESISMSKIEIKNTFKITNYNYKCNSWLLSNKLNEIINKDTNISKFYNLFDVIDGENCIKDILNFVYGLEKCNNYNELQENTTLQKQIKIALLNNENFYLGLGILKNI